MCHICRFFSQDSATSPHILIRTDESSNKVVSHTFGYHIRTPPRFYLGLHITVLFCSSLLEPFAYFLLCCNSVFLFLMSLQFSSGCSVSTRVPPICFNFNRGLTRFLFHNMKLITSQSLVRHLYAFFFQEDQQ